MKRNWKKIWKSRRTLWILLLCLAAGAVAGTVYRSSNLKNDGEQLAEKTGAAGESSLSSADPILSADGSTDPEPEETSAKSENDDDITAEVDDQAEDAREEAVDAEPVSGMILADSLDFLTESTLHWPVEGEVILDFNMEETVYFPTLNQYQCNEAMLIQAEEGTPVCAPAKGVISAIGYDEQIGNYLIIELGDGFWLKMGQLKEITVLEGDVVETGTQIALVAGPTDRFSVEGDNLYLTLTENGEPVDPLDYLQY